MAEEVSSSLDRKLFELLLAISRCLNNMEEMLNTSVLSTEEAAVQQALYEVTVLNPSGKEKLQWISVAAEYIWPDIPSVLLVLFRNNSTKLFCIAQIWACCF